MFAKITESQISEMSFREAQEFHNELIETQRSYTQNDLDEMSENLQYYHNQGIFA